jgi:hypothetical protein
MHISSHISLSPVPSRLSGDRVHGPEPIQSSSVDTGYMTSLKAYFNSQTQLQYRPDRTVVKFHYDRHRMGDPHLQEHLPPKRERLQQIIQLIQHGPSPQSVFDAYSLLYWSIVFVENKHFGGGGNHVGRINPPDLRTTFDSQAGQGAIDVVSHRQLIRLHPSGRLQIFEREDEDFNPPFKLKQLLLDKPGASVINQIV